jgi:uncharacterized membrane protein (DUF485 family)
MPQTATGGAEHHPEVDWAAAERSPEFRELIRRRRSFVVPALAFVFVWYFGFIVLAGYAPGFMGERIYEGFTVGYALALSQFVMTWFLGWLYLRRADRVFDPLAHRAAERALEASEDRSRPERVPARTDGGRFEPARPGDSDLAAESTRRVSR